MLYSAASFLALASAVSATAVSLTPHEQFSSSIGVLGCKINTNRVAYWPGQPGCDDLCVKVSYQGRSLHLLKIDSSGGAHDISYDAWNYLSTGKNATVDPTQGGGIAADWEQAPMSECLDLISTPGSKLPLQAANSINYVVNCPASTWAGSNYVLYNIANSACTLGYNEVCELKLPDNQPKCAHTLGSQDKLEGQPVYDIQYGTGKEVLVTQ